jgi:hypothetical protein
VAFKDISLRDFFNASGDMFKCFRNVLAGDSIRAMRLYDNFFASSGMLSRSSCLRRNNGMADTFCSSNSSLSTSNKRKEEK